MENQNKKIVVTDVKKVNLAIMPLAKPNKWLKS